MHTSQEKKDKEILNDISKYEITTNKNFWNLIKPFLTNKGHLNHQDTQTELVEVCNNHCMNIVDKSSG